MWNFALFSPISEVPISTQSDIADHGYRSKCPPMFIWRKQYWYRIAPNTCLLLSYNVGCVLSTNVLQIESLFDLSFNVDCIHFCVSCTTCTCVSCTPTVWVGRGNRLKWQRRPLINLPHYYITVFEFLCYNWCPFTSIATVSKIMHVFKMNVFCACALCRTSNISDMFFNVDAYLCFKWNDTRLNPFSPLDLTHIHSDVRIRLASRRKLSQDYNFSKGACYKNNSQRALLMFG
jgi:hypothetical protein